MDKRIFLTNFISGLQEDGYCLSLVSYTFKARKSGLPSLTLITKTVDDDNYFFPATRFYLLGESMHVARVATSPLNRLLFPLFPCLHLHLPRLQHTVLMSTSSSLFSQISAIAFHHLHSLIFPFLSRVSYESSFCIRT